MADFAPIKAITFNQSKVGTLADVICPPYDIIPPSEQDNLYVRSPYNIIRLELGKTSDSDNPSDNRYTRAQDTLRTWLADGIMTTEKAPVYFLHEQVFLYGGQSWRRLGIIGGIKADNWGPTRVLPHEETLPKQKADRFQLLTATGCNLSPVMALYDDPELLRSLREIAQSRPPETHAIMPDGEEHLLWKITDAGLQAKIRAQLQSLTLYIADGHHRYETALNYKNELAIAQGTLADDHPANYALGTLYEISDPGLLVLPTHRMLRGLRMTSLDALADALASQGGFAVDRVDVVSAGLEHLVDSLQQAARDSHAFVFMAEGQKALIARISRADALARGLVTRGSEAYRALDVAVLHDYILEKLLGIDQTQVVGEKNVAFTRSEVEAWERVKNSEYEMSVLLNSTMVTQIRDVASAGDRMPQKSTYFQPKLPTGLVVNPVDPALLS